MAQLGEWVDNDPRANISTMLRYIVELLSEEIAELGQSENYDPAMVGRFGDLLKGAWREASPETEKAIRETREISDEQLSAHGLWGLQLKLKFDLLRFFAASYQESPTESWLKKLLEYINRILPSIFGAMRGGTVIDELKKCLELLIRGMSRD